MPSRRPVSWASTRSRSPCPPASPAARRLCSSRASLPPTQYRSRFSNGRLESEFGGLEPDIPVEDHFHDGSLAESGVGAALEQDGRQTRPGAGGATDAGAFDAMACHAAGNSADGRARAGSGGDGADVGGFAAFTGDFAFLAIHLAGGGTIGGDQPRAEV